MARSSNLSRRIDGILGSSRLQLAALSDRRHSILAAAMVAIALVAAVACIRIVPAVEAAQQAPAPVAAKPTTGQASPSAPDQVTSSEGPQTRPEAPAGNPSPSPAASFDDGTSSGIGSSQAPTVPAVPPIPPVPPKSFSWGHSGGKDGNSSFALVCGDGSSVYLDGRDWKALEAAKRRYHSNFIWFEHEGKSYVITDPAIVAQAKGLFEADQPLQTRRAELERMQAKLQAEIANLKPEIVQAEISGPELNAQMAKVQQQIANMHLDKLSSDLSKQFSAEQQAEFNRQVAELSSEAAKSALSGPAFQAQMSKLQQQLAVLERSETKRLAEQIARQARESRRLAQDAAHQAGKAQADSGRDAQIASAEKLKELAERDAEELQDRMGNLNGQFGDIQGRLGEIQGEIGERLGKIGEKQGVIGEQMGSLGEEMGRIGEQQAKIAEQAARKVQSLIDQAFQEGKAKPVD